MSISRGLLHIFEKVMSVSEEDTALSIKFLASNIDWSNFLLNPRRLRGSDFLLRWSQGVWSERRIIEAVNQTNEFFAIPYGPSGTAPKDDVRAFELYFERLEKAGLSEEKRPDILIFSIKEKEFVDKFLKQIGGVGELQFNKESDLQELIKRAKVAIECENSLWVAEKMPDYGSKLEPQKRLSGKLGLKKTAVLPTVIVKEEDRKPLNLWQQHKGLPIHIWHVFFDRAYGIALDEVERLINEGLILPTIQTFQAPGGATTKKAIYKIYYQYAYLLGISKEIPKLIPESIQDKNGHILPYVRFEGGKLELSKEALDLLK